MRKFINNIRSNPDTIVALIGLFLASVLIWANVTELTLLARVSGGGILLVAMHLKKYLYIM